MAAKKAQQLELQFGTPEDKFQMGKPIQIDASRFFNFSELPDGSLSIEAFIKEKDGALINTQRMRLSRKSTLKLVEFCSWWLGWDMARTIPPEKPKAKEEGKFDKFLPGIYRAVEKLTSEVKEGNLALAENITTLIKLAQIRSPMDDDEIGRIKTKRNKKGEYLK